MAIIYHFDVQKHIDEPYKKEGQKYFFQSLRPETYFHDKTVEIISIFVHSKITAEIKNFFPNLKKIVCRSVWTDHVDKEFCRLQGIEILSIPGYWPQVIATHAMALFLMWTRKLYETLSSTKNCFYSYDIPGIRDLSWKTVGVVGTGRIGQKIIQMLRCFDMNVLAYDLFPVSDLQEKLWFSYVSYEELLKKSDVIFLVVNATEENKNMINSDAIALMKKDAALINIARWSLVDEDALLQAIDKFSFVALDVIRDERGEWLSKFCWLKNVYITPHIAYLSDETVKNIWEKTYEFLA